MEYSLIYVSRCILAPDRAVGEVEKIVAVAKSRNSKLGVTGALIYASSTFAQILEGTEPALGELMESIYRDPRHHDVKTLVYTEIERRRYGAWSMGYGGQSLYLRKYIEYTLDRASQTVRDMNAANLIILMQEFDRLAA